MFLLFSNTFKTCKGKEKSVLCASKSETGFNSCTSLGEHPGAEGSEISTYIWNLVGFKVPPSPNPSGILWFVDTGFGSEVPLLLRLSWAAGTAFSCSLCTRKSPAGAPPCTQPHNCCLPTSTFLSWCSFTSGTAPRWQRTLLVTSKPPTATPEQLWCSQRWPHWCIQRISPSSGQNPVFKHEVTMRVELRFQGMSACASVASSSLFQFLPLLQEGAFLLQLLILSQPAQIQPIKYWFLQQNWCKSAGMSIITPLIPENPGLKYTETLWDSQLPGVLAVTPTPDQDRTETPGIFKILSRSAWPTALAPVLDPGRDNMEHRKQHSPDLGAVRWSISARSSSQNAAGLSPGERHHSLFSASWTPLLTSQPCLWPKPSFSGNRLSLFSHNSHRSFSPHKSTCK